MSIISDSEFSKKLIASRKQSDLIKDSEGYKCFTSLLKFKITYFIYRRNYIALKNLLKEYYSDEKNVSSNSIKRFYRQKSIITAIHNLLGSATTFVEIYDDNQIADPFHCFIKELRNYITHSEYFPLTTRWILNDERDVKFESFQVDKFKTYLTERIKKYPKRNGLKLASEFTGALPEPIDFNDVLRRYDLKISQFYKDYIHIHVKSNKGHLLRLITDTEEVHSNLQDIKVVASYPISPVRLRYLKCIVK